MAEAKHTPGVMEVDADLDSNQIHIIIGRTAVARVMVKTDGEGLANAARLALCWNTHDALVNALSEYMETCPEDEDLTKAFQEATNKARAALALARGEA